MNNFWSLYFAELKKVLSKKMVWVALAAGLAFVLLVGMINFSSDGRSAYVEYESEILKAVSGQKMDDRFFENFRNDVNTEISEHPERYDFIVPENSGVVFMNAAENIGQQALYFSIYKVLRDAKAVETVTADSFYTAMRQNIIYDGKELGASDDEIETWMQEYDSIEKPIVYSYALSYKNILDVLFLVGWVLFLNITVALSGLFSDENHYRTDALILSSKNGRLPVSLAKLFSGISVALLQTIILIGGCFGTMFAFYGTAGWTGMIQSVIPSSPWNITIGEMVMIYILLAVATSILYAVVNAALSHVTKSSTVTMATQSAILFAGLFNVPAGMGVIAKIWQLRPTMSLYEGTFCNMYRYGKLNNVEISLLLYAAISAILALYLILSYRKSQVESR